MKNKLNSSFRLPPLSAFILFIRALLFFYFCTVSASPPPTTTTTPTLLGARLLVSLWGGISVFASDSCMQQQTSGMFGDLKSYSRCHFRTHEQRWEYNEHPVESFNITTSWKIHSILLRFVITYETLILKVIFISRPRCSWDAKQALKFLV